LLVLLLSNDLVAKLIDIPPIRATGNRPSHAAAAQFFLLCFDFGLLELDLELCVREDAVVARGGGPLGDGGEAVAEFGDWRQIGGGGVAGAAAGGRMSRSRDGAAFAAGGAGASDCCDGFGARAGCADGVAAAIDPELTHLVRCNGERSLNEWAGLGSVFSEIRMKEEIWMARWNEATTGECKRDDSQV